MTSRLGFEPAARGQDDMMALGRRAVLRRAGSGAALVGASVVAGPKIAAAATASAASPAPADVLNFALNLEYLEAEFYLRATTGRGLPAAYTHSGDGRTAGGTVTGGGYVPWGDTRLAQAAGAIANDEFNHVKFLRAGLGAQAVAEPDIDLGHSFTVLARAAGVVGPTGTFDPFADQGSFLLGAFIFEDVGVTAYIGAAGFLTGTPDLLTYAAGILAVEAYHAGSIRTDIHSGSSAQVVAADKIAALRAKLSGANDDFGPVNGKTYHLADADAYSLAFSRTTRQVLNIVYGGGTTHGLFFPSGMNGAIRS